MLSKGLTTISNFLGKARNRKFLVSVYGGPVPYEPMAVVISLLISLIADEISSSVKWG